MRAAQRLRPSADRLALAARGTRRSGTLSSAAELIADPDVDAVAIATPVTRHFDLALRALKAGKHVLVEKPLDGHGRAGTSADRRGRLAAACR